MPFQNKGRILFEFLFLYWFTEWYYFYVFFLNIFSKRCVSFIWKTETILHMRFFKFMKIITSFWLLFIDFSLYFSQFLDKFKNIIFARSLKKFSAFCLKLRLRKVLTALLDFLKNSSQKIESLFWNPLVNIYFANKSSGKDVKKFENLANCFLKWSFKFFSFCFLLVRCRLSFFELFAYFAISFWIFLSFRILQWCVRKRGFFLLLLEEDCGLEESWIFGYTFFHFIYKFNNS